MQMLFHWSLQDSILEYAGPIVHVELGQWDVGESACHQSQYTLGRSDSKCTEGAHYLLSLCQPHTQWVLFFLTKDMHKGVYLKVWVSLNIISVDLIQFSIIMSSDKISLFYYRLMGHYLIDLFIISIIYDNNVVISFFVSSTMLTMAVFCLTPQSSGSVFQQSWS